MWDKNRNQIFAKRFQQTIIYNGRTLTPPILHGRLATLSLYYQRSFARYIL